MAMADFFKILDDSYKRAKKHFNKSFIRDNTILSRIEIVALCLKNRAGVRALLAGLLAKMINPNADIRKPYSDIAGETGKDCYSGRSYDESYIQRLTAKPYNLPINVTTAFLTPGFRTKNLVLTTDVELEGRPAEMYKSLLLLLDDIQSNRVSSQNVMDEVMRLLILERNKRTQSIQNLLCDIQHTIDKLPLSAEDIVNLVRQHLACKNSSRLPVLIIAAAYRAASEQLGEKILHLHAHNAADKQTGAAGDIEITLIGDNDIATAYEMKMKSVTIADINIALEKIARHRATIQNYIFVTTAEILPDVQEYARQKYEETGGIEVAVLDCLGFLRHFLHLFHRLRTAFLDAYQELVLKESESAVSHTLKETFLSLRKASEGAR
ncbi:MAG: DNA methyltransferase [Phycisphaerae bacterium]|nr:DNA methyltransferase [Phycisphaerae bacterium]